MNAWHLTILAIPFAGLAVLAASPAQAAKGGCDVTVNRAYADGTYEVTKQVMPNSDCICYVQTGKEPQGSGIEQRIADLRQSRRCDGAVVMAIPAGSSAVAGTTAGAAGFQLLPALGVAAAAAAGIVAIDSSNGPASP